MEEQKYFEDSFRVYEKGISLFKYPHVYPIWISYLKKFITRFKGSKLERTRDLFEQAVDKATSKAAFKLYLLYGKFEEDHGLARRAMNIYDRGCRAVEPALRTKFYQIYVQRAAETFGITRTREIYEKAIKNIPKVHLKAMCLKYAGMERKLGEVDRSRAIYTYASQFSNPRVDTDFWKVWHDFEVHHGNEDTFSEMLRIRRSVQAQFAQTNAMDIKPRAAAAAEAATGKRKYQQLNPIAAMEKQAEEVAGAGAKKTDADPEAKSTEELKAMASKGGNTEEIDIGDDSDDSDEVGGENMEIEQKQIPSAVFGSASAEQVKGAMERLKGK